MRTTRLAWILAGLTVLVVLASGARAQSYHIHLATGQVGHAPGSCGGLDDSFHRYVVNQPCGQAIVPQPFSPSDLMQAYAGPQAVVVDRPGGAWLPQLSSDPDARWINWENHENHGYPCSGTARSVLYCATFEVGWANTLCVIDSVAVHWAVDDKLGDSYVAGPNPDGVYIDEISLGPAFRNGSFAAESVASATNVPLAPLWSSPQTHRLEVYQRDVACNFSGLLLSCDLFITCMPSVPGACCDPYTGACTVTFPTDCPSSSNWHADWTCAPNLCPAPVGCCCCPGPTIAITTLAECEQMGACLWLGPGTQCTAENCQPGACCNPLSGACILVFRQSDCVWPSDWHGEWVCTPNPCPQPPEPLGCCCCEDGVGRLTTAAECTCVWLGPGTICTPENCPAPVPAQRESWGRLKHTYR